MNKKFLFMLSGAMFLLGVYVISASTISDFCSYDVNGDHKVSSKDYRMIVDGVRSGSTNHLFDVNSDGVVNHKDIFAANKVIKFLSRTHLRGVC